MSANCQVLGLPTYLQGWRNIRTQCALILLLYMHYDIKPMCGWQLMGVFAAASLETASRLMELTNSSLSQQASCVGDHSSQLTS